MIFVRSHRINRAQLLFNLVLERVVSEFENLLCGPLRISALSALNSPLTQRTQRYAEIAEKTDQFETPLFVKLATPYAERIFLAREKRIVVHRSFRVELRRLRRFTYA